ncbi:MAG: geranylgeranylglycerol-phosphate geranylgeranyltransferase, partial [Flavobacteriales bacterium]
KLSPIHFSALVLSALLVTAAGNVINDYFDQRVDKINKPERIIVGKKINRKHAILIHQGLNILAFALVFWVATSNRYWMVLLFPLATTFMLWWYSPVFKKKPLIGNVIVAMCTALVPVFAAICDLQIMQPQLALLSYSSGTLYNYAWLWILGIAAFAFVLTMIREVVKDAQDEPGDRSEHYQTLPILWGTQRTKRYVMGWIIIFFAMVAACAFRITNATDMLWLVGCLVAPMMVALYRVYAATTSADFGKVSSWIKLVMLGGLLLLVAILV